MKILRKRTNFTKISYVSDVFSRELSRIMTWTNSKRCRSSLEVLTDLILNFLGLGFMKIEA